MANVRTILATALLVTLSVLVIRSLAPAVHPSAGVAPSQNAVEVLAQSKRLLREMGYDVTGLTPGVLFRFNRTLVRQVQQEYGMEHGNTFIRTQIPAYYWEIRWRKKGPMETFIGATGSEVREVEKTLRGLLGEISLRIDQQSRLLEFESKLADSAHLPVRKTGEDKTEFLRPDGLALGFEPGEKFSKTIREVKISFQSGDLFVFYTDGFTEAMNKSLEEFGEDRFRMTIEKFSTGTASDVLEGIFKEMKAFTGKAKQNDDMTMVVVRIV